MTLQTGVSVTVKGGFGGKTEIYGQFNDFRRLQLDTAATVERVMPNGDVIVSLNENGKRSRFWTCPAAIKELYPN